LSIIKAVNRLFEFEKLASEKKLDYRGFRRDEKVFNHPVYLLARKTPQWIEEHRMHENHGYVTSRIRFTQRQNNLVELISRKRVRGTARETFIHLRHSSDGHSLARINLNHLDKLLAKAGYVTNKSSEADELFDKIREEYPGEERRDFDDDFQIFEKDGTQVAVLHEGVTKESVKKANALGTNGVFRKYGRVSTLGMFLGVESSAPVRLIHVQEKDPEKIQKILNLIFKSGRLKLVQKRPRVK